RVGERVRDQVGGEADVSGLREVVPEHALHAAALDGPLERDPSTSRVLPQVGDRVELRISRPEAAEYRHRLVEHPLVRLACGQHRAGHALDSPPIWIPTGGRGARPSGVGVWDRFPRPTRPGTRGPVISDTT